MTFRITPEVKGENGAAYAANELVVDPAATPVFTFDPIVDYTVARLKTWPMGDGVPAPHNVYFTYNAFGTHTIQLNPYSQSWTPYQVTATLLDDTLAVYTRDQDRELYAVTAGDPGEIQTEPHLVPSGTVDIRIWGNVGSNPDINGDWTATVVNEIIVSIPVEILEAGEGGTVTFKDVPLEDIPLNLLEDEATSDQSGFQGLVDGDYTAVITWPDVHSFWGDHAGGETQTEFTIDGMNLALGVDVPNMFDGTCLVHGFSAADIATAGGSIDLSLWYRITDYPTAGLAPNNGGTGWTLVSTRTITKEMFADPIETTNGDLPDGLAYWYLLDFPDPPPYTYLDVCCTWSYSGNRWSGIVRPTVGGPNTDFSGPGTLTLNDRDWSY